jgi:hypothetical protein
MPDFRCYEPLETPRRGVGSSASLIGRLVERSIGRGADDQTETGCIREGPEIRSRVSTGIPRSMQALGDQRIAQTRLAAFRQHSRGQLACALPIAGFDFDHRQLGKSSCNLREELGVAQDFGDCNGRH